MASSLRSSDISFGKEVHGNAGHIAQGWRPDTYRYLTTQPNTHVITIDYRGFAKSTGYPTEAGLILDGIAVVDWVLNEADIPPEKIVILGQSLGTAVASAVGLAYADTHTTAGEARVYNNPRASEAITFAGIILVAPFYSLPSLLLTYRIGGWLPVLLPLRPFPALASRLTSQTVDKWPTADRLAEYYRKMSADPNFNYHPGRSTGFLQLLHAINDRDISYHQTEKICTRMFATEEACVKAGHDSAVLDVRDISKPRVRIEITKFGGKFRRDVSIHVAAADL